ncbi:hypothetical protein G5I_04664 [Acromyrmex echinatior]|uniref:Uncharacterized protein n=1 Tax=Acromyrmex echinatior TaxID=103372 RepID=F4WG90_ACREC|nr:hypothetical protein G5I_04664 [Acromyrmex echinatior]
MPQDYGRITLTGGKEFFHISSVVCMHKLRRKYARRTIGPEGSTLPEAALTTSSFSRLVTRKGAITSPGCVDTHFACKHAAASGRDLAHLEGKCMRDVSMYREETRRDEILADVRSIERSEFLN